MIAIVLFGMGALILTVLCGEGGGFRILWMVCQNILGRFMWAVFLVNVYGTERTVQGVCTPPRMVRVLVSLTPSCFHGSVGHGWEVVERYIRNQEKQNAKSLCTGSVLKSGV